MSRYSAPMERSRHELLSDVACQVTNELKAFGIDPEVAGQVGDAIANHLAEHWGGQSICYPKDHIFKINARDQEIYARFNGTNHGQLAREYKLSVRAVYTLLKRVQKRMTDRAQHQLDL